MQMLKTAVTPPPADALTIRTFTPADIPAGVALCTVAGWNQTAVDWRLLVHLGGDRCLAAVLGDAVVGTVTTVSYQDRFAWIGMVLVDPAVRGQGIGRRLLDASLRGLGPVPARLDATPQGHRLYVGLGFAEECRLRRMTRASASPPEAAAADGVRPMQAHDLASVFEWDLDVFGADRRDLLQAAFDAAPDRAFVVEGHGGPSGYCFGRVGRIFRQVGPVVACGLDAGQRLVAACCLGASGTPLVIDVPSGPGEWTERLIALDFVEQRPFIRMCRGANAHPGRPDQGLAIFGPEWG